MVIFLLSFQYYTNVHHSIYQYDENFYSVTNSRVYLQGNRWDGDILFTKYRDIFGVKRFQVRYDSISAGGNNDYHVVLGDMDYLRGIEVGYGYPSEDYQFNLRVGKMRDLHARVLPSFIRNNFFSEMELFIPNHKFTLNSRWDNERVSNMIGDEFDIYLGDLAILSDLKIGYLERTEFAVNEDIIYRKKFFSMRSFLRYYSRGFVSQEGVEYTGGRFNWGITPSYTFPTGLNVFSGFYQTGRLDSRLRNQVLDGFSYRFPINFSVNFTNSINWGGDRENGYRNYLSLSYYLYNRGKLNFRYRNSYFDRRDESFEVEGVLNLPRANVLEAAVSKSVNYGWEYSLGALLRMGSSIYGDFRLRHILKQERLNYNAFLSFGIGGGFSSRVGVSGNTGSESKIYTIELVKRGSVDEVGFGAVSGWVWHDENGDGKKQSAEPPLEDVKVVLDGDKKVDVNSRGQYKFVPISKGAHTVSLDIKGVPAFLGGDSLVKKVNTGLVDFKEINFPIFSLSSIRGIVYYDKNHNFRKDPDEKGVSNIRVSIIRGDYSRHTYTNFFGEYSINNIVPGDYTIQASRFPPGYDLSPRGFVLYLQLAGGEKRENLNFGIAKPVKKIERKEF
jgi:hypothetical protein